MPELELLLLAKADSLACKALKLAINKHKNQVDLANKPHINHIVAVKAITKDNKYISYDEYLKK